MKNQKREKWFQKHPQNTIYVSTYIMELYLLTALVQYELGITKKVEDNISSF